MAWSREGKQSRSDSVQVMLDSLEVRFKRLSERDLAASRSDDQTPELFDEQVYAVGLKLLCRERVSVTKLTLDIIQGGPDPAELHLVNVADRVKYVRFDQIDEGQQAYGLFLGRPDQAMETPLTALNRVVAPGHPGL